MPDSIKRYRIKLDMEYGMGDCEEVECPNGPFVRVDDLLELLKKRRDEYEKFAQIAHISSDHITAVSAAGSFLLTEQLIELFQPGENEAN